MAGVSSDRREKGRARPGAVWTSIGNDKLGQGWRGQARERRSTNGAGEDEHGSWCSCSRQWRASMADRESQWTKRKKMRWGSGQIETNRHVVQPVAVVGTFSISTMYPLRSFTKMVNLASRCTILLNLDLVDLDRLSNFFGGAELFLVNLELVNLYRSKPIQKYFF